MNAWFVNFGIYERYKVVDIDRLARFAPETPPAAGDHPAAVVLIHDDEFKQYFHREQPLSPAPLLNVLRTLCQLPVARIGVDIFSDRWPSSGGLSNMTQQELNAAVAGLGNCPIVWIRAAEEMKTNSAKSTGAFVLGGVLGRDAPVPGVCSALPVFSPDFDSVIRQDRSWVPAGLNAGDARPYVTMPEALRAPPAHSQCGFLREEDKQPKAVTIGYRQNAGIVRLSFSDFYFDGTESQRQSFYNSRRELARNFRMGPKTIVILGAAYPDARDSHSTPIGELYGTEILANAAIGKPIHDLSLIAGLLCDVVVCLLLMWLLNLCFERCFTLQSIFAVLLSLGFAFLFTWFLYIFLGAFAGVYTSLIGALIAVAGQPALEKMWREMKAYKRLHWNASSKRKASSLPGPVN